MREIERCREREMQRDAERSRDTRTKMEVGENRKRELERPPSKGKRIEGNAESGCE